jgi:hypothetical protein
MNRLGLSYSCPSSFSNQLHGRLVSYRFTYLRLDSASFKVKLTLFKLYQSSLEVEREMSERTRTLPHAKVRELYPPRAVVPT